ncbi:hypothetical protein GCM10027082_41980 [Comamonas humi]
MQVRPCTFAGWQDAGAPQVRLVQGLSIDRDQARLQARAALRACLAPGLGCDEGELQITNQRGQAPQLLRRGEQLAAPHCSISHAPGLALLAWHWSGPVGVDIQAIDTGAPRCELEGVARLFLKSKTALALIGIAQEALFLEAFATAWTQHEARLKCAGLGLVEWSGELEARLAGIRSAEVPLGAAHAAAIAWRP